jgi:hypothetical protein
MPSQHKRTYQQHQDSSVNPTDSSCFLPLSNDSAEPYIPSPFPPHPEADASALPSTGFPPLDPALFLELDVITTVAPLDCLRLFLSGPPSSPSPSSGSTRVAMDVGFFFLLVNAFRGTGRVGGRGREGCV